MIFIKFLWFMKIKELTIFLLRSLSSGTSMDRASLRVPLAVDRTQYIRRC